MSKLVIVIILVFLAACSFVLVACAKNNGQSTSPPIADPVPMPTTVTPTATAEPDTSAAAMLTTYERVRAALAADDANRAAMAARELDGAAQAAAGKAPPAAAPHYKEIATTAEALASATDLGLARKSFGELSRHVVALLATDKTLAQGKHVFECPMAKDYKKWVQTTEHLENPYMGKQMLTCGGKSTWD